MLIPASGNNRIFFLDIRRVPRLLARSLCRIVNFLFSLFFFFIFSFSSIIVLLDLFRSLVIRVRVTVHRVQSRTFDLHVGASKRGESAIVDVTSCIVNQSWRISFSRLRPTRVHAYRYTSKYFSTVCDVPSSRIFSPMIPEQRGFPSWIFPRFYQILPDGLSYRLVGN